MIWIVIVAAFLASWFFRERCVAKSEVALAKSEVE